MKFLLVLTQATPVLPEPINGSRIVCPLSVVQKRSRSIKRTGFWVGCCLLLLLRVIEIMSCSLIPSNIFRRHGALTVEALVFPDHVTPFLCSRLYEMLLLSIYSFRPLNSFSWPKAFAIRFKSFFILLKSYLFFSI